MLKETLPILLLVDDKPENLESLEAVLDDGKRRFIRVASGQDALRILLNETIALVLMDVDMPELDGIEAVKLMRKNSRTRHIPVLLVTAHGEDEYASLDGLEAGAFDLMHKPIQPRILEAKVQQLLNQWALSESSKKEMHDLAQVNAFLGDILNTVNEGISVVAPDLSQIYVNPAGSRLQGLTQSEVKGKILHCWSDLQMDMLLGAYRSQHAIHSHAARIISAKEAALPVQLSCAPLPQQQGWVVAYQDITAALTLQEELAQLIVTDTLTGALNRNGFFQAVSTAVSRSLRHSQSLYLLYIDLDYFKDVNDTYGHATGDMLLQSFCERLRSQLRTHDALGRIGGDEFAILIEGALSETEISAIAEKLLRIQAQPYVIDGHSLLVSVSIGIANCPEDSTSAGEMLRAADMAMYQAKRNGRQSYRHYSAEMNAQVTARTMLRESLMYALEKEQFELVFQPQVSTLDGRIHGIEALLRWHHPTAGTVSPAVFIPVLEDSGLIVEVSLWILRTACAQRMAWADILDDSVTMAVNLSARQFSDELICKHIQDVISDTGIPARWLEVEVTESTVIEDIDKGRRILEDLHKLGIRTAMDDFGTGYSALAYLKQLPLDVLKIDRLFVANLANDTKDQAIARAIIGLAHELGMTLVAEGVETHEQYGLLSSMGCELIQGYLFSRPIPAIDFAKLALGQPLMNVR
ncbi:two-component system response regulator [Chitinimonas prasina]|uniref:Two-component system response regulator n=1 Tax=Chitinimonas prasina TaxID=1434937 RepID=A0ABQ5YB36_9NEIS|nr:EAL domain-containing protein [Chitinimonas prasina]GLR12165.1 two-component system response regulator [Chitinimonas prasina]